jgi:hypothetical protein
VKTTPARCRDASILAKVEERGSQSPFSIFRTVISAKLDSLARSACVHPARTRAALICFGVIISPSDIYRLTDLNVSFTHSDASENSLGGTAVTGKLRQGGALRGKAGSPNGVEDDEDSKT